MKPEQIITAFGISPTKMEMMSKGQIQINYYLSLAVKIGFGIATWFAVSMVKDIKEEIKSNGKDLRNINDKLIHLEDKATTHDDDIRTIKDFLNSKFQKL